MKTLMVVLSLAVFATACSHKKQVDAGSGYTHSDERSSREGTGVQEDQMSSGDPQNPPATNN